jgi:hypothetical protein
MRIKILGSAVTLTTTPSVVSATAVDVLIVHQAGGNVGRTITLYENDGTTVVGSFFLNSGSQIVIRKRADQKLNVDAGTDVRATAVGYLS